MAWYNQGVRENGRFCMPYRAVSGKRPILSDRKIGIPDAALCFGVTMPRLPDRFVYLIKVPEFGKSLYKIGYSINPDRRFEELEYIYGKVEPIGIFKFNQTEHIEDILHKVFENKRYTDYEFHREIFRFTDSDVLTCLIALKALQMLEVRTAKLHYKWLSKNKVNFPEYFN